MAKSARWRVAYLSRPRMHKLWRRKVGGSMPSGKALRKFLFRRNPRRRLPPRDRWGRFRKRR